MKTLIKKLISNKELILYLIFGILTTVVNFIVYSIATRLFSIEELLANALSWLIAVIFAYVTNKLYVFSSKSWTVEIITKELTGFLTARVFSLGVDTLIMFFGIKILLMFDLYVKLISQVVVVILNYVLSKYFVFKNKPSNQQ